MERKIQKRMKPITLTPDVVECLAQVLAPADLPYNAPHEDFIKEAVLSKVRRQIQSIVKRGSY